MSTFLCYIVAKLLLFLMFPEWNCEQSDSVNPWDVKNCLTSSFCYTEIFGNWTSDGNLTYVRIVVLLSSAMYDDVYRVSIHGDGGYSFQKKSKTSRNINPSLRTFQL